MSGMKSMLLHSRNWTMGSRASLIGVSVIAVGVFAMLYLGLPILFLPLGLGTLLLALIIIRSPTLGLSFVIAAQFFPLQFAGFTLLQILGVFVAVLCLFWLAAHRQEVVFPNIIFPIVVMILLALYSLTFTRDAALTQYAIRKMIFNIVFCLLLVNVIDGYRRLRTPFMVLMAMGVINSITGVLQFATRSDSEFRARGLLENQNTLGEVAAMTFIVAFYHFLYEKDRWRQMGYLGICTILSAGIVTSVSRGATISFVVGLLYILVREKRYRKQYLLLGLLILAALPLLPSIFFQRFSSLGEDVEGTVFLNERFGLSSRGYYNKGGIRIWKAHPVLGVGLGSYGYYFIQPEFNPGKEASHRLPPHNIYIQALAETGLVGFLVLCWWILQAAYNYWVAERKGDEDPQGRLYLRLCETVTLFTLVLNLTGGNLVRTSLAMVIALSAVCRRCSERAEPDQTVAAGG